MQNVGKPLSSREDLRNPGYKIRTYAPGDETVLTSIYNQSYGRYAGFVARTVQHWLWSCTLRPEIGSNGIFVACKGQEIVGYVAVGRSSQSGKSFHIYEMCVGPAQNDTAIISQLVEKACEYAREMGASDIFFYAPADDIAIKKVCNQLGFSETHQDDVLGFILLDPVSFVEQVIKSKENLWGRRNEIFLLRLKGLPPQVNSLAIGWNNKKLSVSTRVDHEFDAVIDTDLLTLKRLIFGEENILRAVLRSKLRIRPFWKVLKCAKLLSLLYLRDPWFLPRGDYM